jgi:peptidoglycan/LPS O-acetylase OafA/YrhL
MPEARGRLIKLEALRGLAALYVFAGHVVLYRLNLKETAFGQLFRFGQEAVMLFFLLSGFVIFYSTELHKDKTFRTYFVRRWRRIYPILFLALILAFLATSQHVVRNASFFGELFGNVLMFQDEKTLKPGVFVGTFLGNTPLWSLSYEWWFYMMFYTVWKFVAPARQLILVAVLSAIGFVSFVSFPNQVSLFLTYFIIWWAGVEMARCYCAGKLPNFRNQWRSILIVGLACSAWGIICFHWHGAGRQIGFGVHPILEFRHFFAALVLMAGGILWASHKWLFFNATVGWFAHVAPISYALYLFHIPLCVSNIVWPWLSKNTGAQLGFSVILTFLLAYLAEVPFQRIVNRFIR